MSDDSAGSQLPDDSEPDPLEKLRRRKRADDEARQQAWDAEHAGDPDDPFTEDDMVDAVKDIDREIYYRSLGDDDDRTWLRVIHQPRPPLQLFEFTMGDSGSDEPKVSLIVSDYDVHDLIARIIETIGPDPRQKH
jgi:hypothetical protein